MKFILSIICLSILLVSCQQPQDNSAKEKFAKNSETVKAYLEGFQNENADYSSFADNFVSLGTGFGSQDSISLDQMKEWDKESWKMFDFKLLNDPLVLLPGVNSDTKELDGSVRYYGAWKVTVPETDSTEAKSGVLRIYESYDFDENGKILYQQGYGDFGGLMEYLMKPVPKAPVEAEAAAE